MHFPGVISRAETVAAGSGLRSEGVATAPSEGVCGGEVVALPIPERSTKLVPTHRVDVDCDLVATP